LAITMPIIAAPISSRAAERSLFMALHFDFLSSEYPVVFGYFS